MSKPSGLPLFDLPSCVRPPLARSRDPETSQIAAYEVQQSGKLARQAEVVLAAVRKHPGKTSCELADLMQLDRYTPSRRCPALADAGRVYRGSKRACKITGKMSFTWWPALAEEGPK